MKSKGFRKVGKYDYGATFDKAMYKSSESECQEVFSTHPYDYPFHEFRFEKISQGRKVFEKQYSFEGGDLAYQIDALAKDLITGEIEI